MSSNIDSEIFLSGKRISAPPGLAQNMIMPPHGYKAIINRFTAE
jgi:hypothetical protein